MFKIWKRNSRKWSIFTFYCSDDKENKETFFLFRSELRQLSASLPSELDSGFIPAIFSILETHNS